MSGVIRQAVGNECPSRTELVRVGGDVPWAGWRVGGLVTAVRKGAQSGQGAIELILPGPALGQVKIQAAGRAGEPPGQGEETPPQGLGGDQLLTETDAGGPAVQARGPCRLGPLRRAMDGAHDGPHAEAQLMHGVQIPLDAADGQPPLFPQRGDQAEHVDADTRGKSGPYRRAR